MMVSPSADRSHQRQSRLYAFVWGAVVGLLGFGLTLMDAWSFLLANAGDYVFGDLRIVTEPAGCLVNLNQLSSAGPHCAGWASETNAFPPPPYNYPSFWYRGLAYLGVTGDSTFWLGLALITLFAVSIGVLTWLTLRGEKSILKASLVLYLALTPPSLLAMERGNTDLVAFALLVGGILALHLKQIWVATTLLSASAIFKLFPVGAGLALLQSARKQQIPIFVFLAVVVIGVLSYLPDLQFIAGRTPQATSPSFGGSVLPMIFATHLLKVELSPSLARILGIGFFSLVFFFFWLFTVKVDFGAVWKQRWNRSIGCISRDRSARAMFVSGGGAFTFSYLLGSNFDYRGIFLLPVIFGLIRILDRGNPLPTASIFIMVLTLTLFNSPSGFSNLADLSLLFVTPILALAVVQIVGRELKPENTVGKR